MKQDKIVKLSRKLSRRYRITAGKDFRLADIQPSDTAWLGDEDRSRAKDALRDGVKSLSELQEMLYAQDRWAVLVIFQAMDAAGKDSAIKHVMSGVNPQGCQVASFKAPSPEELDHDYLWRCTRHLPERGRIGIFNRSYYEEVLVVRVHEELLHHQKLPLEFFQENIWERRYRDIRAYERYLGANGTLIRKFFLHVSRGEQKQRFLERIERPEKNWKFSADDVAERQHWNDYMAAYEQMIRNTATTSAPWYVVPADNKWFTRIVVAAALIDALSSIGLHYPVISEAKRKELARAKRDLLAEKED
jgi:PPK2 family polyphosphate:nucleotide phosphotransferase